MVQRIRDDPLSRALEDRELLDLVRNGRADLEPARAGADESEPFAGQLADRRATEPSGTTVR